MNRREALVTISLTALSGAALTSLPLEALLRHAGAAALNPPVDEAIDDRLREDMARLAPRVNSEEGIGMFLACENLVPDTATHMVPSPALTPLNAALASAMQRNAEAWLRIKPDAKYKDVAQLIEILAYRDLSRQGAAEQL